MASFSALRRTARIIFLFGERFTEGEHMNFSILRELLLDSGERYFLLESPGFNRLLLPARTYQAYNILPGQMLECCIDKINCSGRVFLEPVHPRFNNGSVYQLEVTGSEEIIDRKGRNINLYTVKTSDELEYKARFDSPEMIKSGTIITAILHKIRKGVLLISKLEFIHKC